MQHEGKKKNTNATQQDDPVEDSVTTPLLNHRLNIRTMCSDMLPTEVRTSNTVAALFLGEDSRAEQALFEIGVRSRGAQKIMWGLWFTGAILGLLVVGEVLPLHLVWVSTLMLPLSLVTTLLFSVDVLRSLCSSLDLYVLLILQFAFFVDGIYYCLADKRCIFWCCYLPTAISSLFVDAYPAKFRGVFAQLFFSVNIGMLVIWNLLLAFKWHIFWTPKGGMMNMSFMLHHVSDQVALGVFYCRHLWVSTFNPEYFVMIHASVCTKHDTVEVSYEIEDGMEVCRAFIPCRKSEVKLQKSISRKSECIKTLSPDTEKAPVEVKIDKKAPVEC